MKHINNYLRFILMLFLTLNILSCKKDYLDKKPDKALLIPTTLQDFQAILDNSNIMNVIPSLTLLCVDDIATTDNGYKAFTNNYERNTYIWKADLFEGKTNSDWNRPYQIAFYANIVLDGLSGLSKNAGNAKQYDQIRGSALFFRAYAFYNLAQEFAVPYHQSTAKDDLGIPIRLSSDINEKTVRATTQQTYEQISNDLKQAESLLPEGPAAVKNRPSKAAAQALLARVYQTIESYDLAEQYATKYLETNYKLIDFNALSTTSTNPFPSTLPNGNDEVVFNTSAVSYSFLNSALTGIDISLYQTYSANDLRKVLFFRDRGNQIYTFKAFRGIATDEVYLIRAECFARRNKVKEAMDDLNTLLITRWKKGAYVSMKAENADEALKIVLTERRKELYSRGLRWTDLRRLNQDVRFAVTLKRTVNGEQFVLSPNDKRYTFPIPDDEVLLSGLIQNPR